MQAIFTHCASPLIFSLSLIISACVSAIRWKLPRLASKVFNKHIAFSSLIWSKDLGGFISAFSPSSTSRGTWGSTTSAHPLNLACGRACRAYVPSTSILDHLSWIVGSYACCHATTVYGLSASVCFAMSSTLLIYPINRNGTFYLNNYYYYLLLLLPITILCTHTWRIAGDFRGEMK